MIKRISIISIIVMIPLVIAAWIIFNSFIAMSMIFGTAIALFNLRAMKRGLTGLLGADKAATRLVIFGIVRLFILSALIIILAVFKAVNLLGLLAGFIPVQIIVLIEGIREAKSMG